MWGEVVFTAFLEKTNKGFCAESLIFMTCSIYPFLPRKMLPLLPLCWGAFSARRGIHEMFETRPRSEKVRRSGTADRAGLAGPRIKRQACACPDL